MTTKSIYKIERKIQTLDATGQTVGRLSSLIARLLMGKHKVSYTPQVDGGDFVTVTNAAKLKFTGKKLEQKNYYRHSGYPGGLKTKKASELARENQGKMITLAVYKMLPKNKFRDNAIRRLTVKN